MKRTPTLVYVEGLWGTGKSHFLSELKKVVNPKKVKVHDDLRKLNSMRHASYIIYPTAVDSKYQIFDRSPITLKVISNPSLNLYDGREVPSDYWNAYYDEWVTYLKSSLFKTVILYFRPFTEGKNISLEILDKVKTYDKDRLLINPNRVTLPSLEKLHNLYMETVLETYNTLKPRSMYYGVDFKDADEAIEILRYEDIIETPKTPRVKREAVG
jgi:hypothetical protein